MVVSRIDEGRAVERSAYERAEASVAWLLPFRQSRIRTLNPITFSCYVLSNTVIYVAVVS